MTYSSIRNWLISIVFFGYIVLVLSLILLWVIGGFKFDEFTTTVGILLPLLSSHVATVVAYFQHTTAIQNDNRLVPKLQAAVAITPPLLLIVTLTALSYVKAFRFSSMTFEDYKTALAVIYGCFGAYVATIVTYYLRDSAIHVNVELTSATAGAPASEVIPSKETSTAAATLN
ncbi:hypothetical protein [Mesorhizobium sp. M0571]|uniref:hypothetical protein n=1 Tax=Mesorhizobium sp. M0571 TaxID=2956960 RepID=UPI0033380376